MDHYCQSPDMFPLDKFHQLGKGRGRVVLIVGESPAANGWRVSGKAFYTPRGRFLPSGRRLNALLLPLGLSVETCGFTELVKCFVGKDKKRLANCCQGCWPIFVKQIKLTDYKLIIILGVKTLEIFNKINNSDLKTGIMSKFKIDDKEYSILPIYHPSPINPHGQRKNKLIFESQEVAKLFYLCGS